LISGAKVAISAQKGQNRAYSLPTAKYRHKPVMSGIKQEDRIEELKCHVSLFR